MCKAFDEMREKYRNVGYLDMRKELWRDRYLNLSVCPLSVAKCVS